MAKHHPDLIMCRKQPGVGELDLFIQEVVLNIFSLCHVAIGRLCEKCELLDLKFNSISVSVVCVLIYYHSSCLQNSRE